MDIDYRPWKTRNVYYSKRYEQPELQKDRLINLKFGLKKPKIYRKHPICKF